MLSGINKDWKIDCKKCSLISKELNSMLYFLLGATSSRRNTAYSVFIYNGGSILLAFSKDVAMQPKIKSLSSKSGVCPKNEQKVDEKSWRKKSLYNMPLSIYFTRVLPDISGTRGEAPVRRFTSWRLARVAKLHPPSAVLYPVSYSTSMSMSTSTFYGYVHVRGNGRSEEEKTLDEGVEHRKVVAELPGRGQKGLVGAPKQKSMGRYFWLAFYFGSLFLFLSLYQRSNL